MMELDEIEVVDKFVGKLKNDIAYVKSDIQLLNLPDDVANALGESLKILDRKVREIEHVENKKQLKKHVDLKAILEEGMKK